MNSTTLTFGYSRSISLLLAVLALFFIFLPILLPYVSRDHGVPSAAFLVGSWVFAAVELLVAVYCYFYKVVLTSGHLSYGIFIVKNIYFYDVSSIKYRSSPQINTIDIVTKQGGRISFTSSISRFNDLWVELQSRLAPLGVRCE